MSDRNPEIAAAATHDDHCSGALGHSDQMNVTAAQSASASPAPIACAAAATATSVVGVTNTAASTVTSSPAGPVASSGAEIADSAAVDCAPAPTATAADTAADTAIATVALASPTPPPSTAGASPSAAARSSSASSSSSSTSAPSLSQKKCACCNRLLPDGDYSGAQLKAKGKRQCKVCVVGLQIAQRNLNSSGAAVNEEQRQRQHQLVRSVTESMTGPSGPRKIESSILAALSSLVDTLRYHGEQINSAIIRSVTDMMKTALFAAKESPTDQLRSLALEGIALMARRPALLTQLVIGGVIPILLGLLGPRDHQPALSEIQTVWNVDAVAHIAGASRANCDALLAAGAMGVLLPLVRADMSADLRDELFPALDHLMSGRPAAEMAAAVTSLGAVLMDGAVSAKLLFTCVRTFNEAVIKFAIGDPILESWVESILSAASGFPQRLVQLLGDTDRADVVDMVLRLMVNLFNAQTERLRQLFDCGLLDKLLPLLDDAGGEQARTHAASVCCNASSTKAFARLLLDSAPIVQRMLVLLSSSENETLRRAATFIHNVFRHCDRHLSHRLVDDHGALPPLVSALRRACDCGDQTAVRLCLNVLASVLIVGDIEAADDPINPYNAPLDRLGVFELIDLLQNSSDAEIAEQASCMFGDFILRSKSEPLQASGAGAENDSAAASVTTAASAGDTVSAVIGSSAPPSLVAAAPTPSIVGWSPSAAASSSSSSSSSSAASSSAAPVALKKCACCHRRLPDGDYSGAQLKAKGKRQCKVCIAGLQKMQSGSTSSSTLTDGVARPGRRLEVIEFSECLSSPLESAQMSGLAALINQMRDTCGPNGTAVDISMDTKLVVGVLRIARESPSNQVRSLALVCIALMVRRSTLLVQLVAGGVIPILLQMLRPRDHRPRLTANETFGCVQAVAHVAMASRANCDALLAADALTALLPLVDRPNISADLRDILLPTLNRLMRGRPAAEVAAVVTRLGTLLMDVAAPPELLYHCLVAFGEALISVADEDSDVESWVESTLAAAPGVPRRLVELLGNRDRPEVVVAMLRLMISFFNAETNQPRQLFDCGLLDKLPALLHDASGQQARLHAAWVCHNAARTKAYARLLVDSASIIQPLLALMSTSEGAVQQRAAAFFYDTMSHRDRDMTRGLVDEYRALPHFVATLRRAIESGDQLLTHACLRSVARVLIVGDAEAVDDERGINPYIEPLDFQLSAFELIEPLQNHPDAAMAETARRVYSYFIPNDCE